ncbi:PLP-dependent aspartate aminotransferase family protein [Schumannella sp. 10F1B-5-1]|uniref:trans-sulfuration enzyme family protein n=1 Tax=Schumannella sp. 10F1B-5-1 TaxID=2590780 RepID=UPI00112FEFFA|nr:PLP-dependent aspartate aminotransferase family protein [Schumannella sp. 10F1B-5-1]TPW71583.1 PLP-dependent transferase [Schumannella sp. 10F1B-5-1]
MSTADSAAHAGTPLQPATTAVVAGRPAPTPDAPLNTPVVFASTFIGGGELEYGRFGNPTWTALEDAIGALEGGDALVYASGLAAANALIATLPVGAKVVAPNHAYLGSLTQLDEAQERGQLTRVYVDISDTDAVLAELDGASLLWIESPTNPALEVADLPTLIAAAHAQGVLTVVDNTFATPILQRPLEVGADVVLHSATKFLSGHSDAVLGTLIVRDAELHARLVNRRTILGATPGPMEVYLVLRGLRTLALRVERASQNAAELVARMSGHPALAELRYPGFGAIVAPVFPDAATAERFVAAAQLARFATSLGGVETTLERRRRWAGEVATIPEGLVRISVGIEHIDDLAADLLQALDAAAEA